MASSSNIVPFPTGSTNVWIEDYQRMCLVTHHPRTVRVYRQVLHQFLHWVTTKLGKARPFDPTDLTPPLIERYLGELATQGYSASHCHRVKTGLGHLPC